jgi:hypothetical protein
MGYKKISVGADRFLALKWANYAFELFQTQADEDYLYHSLSEYLDTVTKGVETSRKTSNHLKRLWLTKDDDYQLLRLETLKLPVSSYPELLPILHLGLSMNIFPIYRETQKAIGMLDRIINPIPKQSVVDRVLETFGNTSSIPRAVARVLQTLEDWGFISNKENYVSIIDIDLQDNQYAEWFIKALVSMNNSHGIAISDLPLIPEKLGIVLPNPREIIQRSEDLVTSHNLQGLEIITIKK